MFISPGSRAKAGGKAFPTGTVLLFYQAAAPLGWTKLTTQNDKAIRVVSGAGGVAGGTNAFSTVMAQTVVGSSSLSTAQLANHSHTVGNQGATNTAGIGCSTNYATGGAGNTGASGSGSTHNHTIALSVQFIDIILASKN